MSHPARWWQADGLAVRCGLCPHRCVLQPGHSGLCRARKNEQGSLVSLAYGQVVSSAVDPIEKKPLYHFHPGSAIFSAGVNGCNFRCSFCQNWQISQTAPGTMPTEVLLPADAARICGQQGSIGIAYTYNEPLIQAEWVLDTARLVRAAGRVNVLVTNGYVLPEPLGELLPVIDAANIDVKAFTEEFYHKLCGASLEPVLRTVETMFRAGVHVELTTLLIPGKNDSEAEIEQLSTWIASVSPDIPLHFSRYFPQYKYVLHPATERSVMLRAYQVARRRLKFVYLGNIVSPEHEQTSCPECGAMLIRRHGYATEVVGLHQGQCRQCGSTMYGTF